MQVFLTTDALRKHAFVTAYSSIPADVDGRLKGRNCIRQLGRQARWRQFDEVASLNDTVIIRVQADNGRAAETRVRDSPTPAFLPTLIGG